MALAVFLVGKPSQRLLLTVLQSLMFCFVLFVVLPYSLPSWWYPPPAPLHVCLCPLFVSLVSFLAQRPDIGLLFLLFLYTLFLSCLPSGLFFFFFFFLCRPYFSPSAGHIKGLIVPANSNFVPQGLGLRPQRLFSSRSFFYFPSFLRIFLSFPSSCFFFFLFFFSGVPVHTMDLFLV